MLRRRFLATLPVALLAALAGPSSLDAHEFTAKGVTVAHPWARATPGGAKVGATYMTIAAAKGAGDKLIAAKSDVAGRVELHTHIMEGDVMKMRRVDAIAVPAGKFVRLQPSGDHIMLIDLKQPLKDGDVVKLTLTFEKAGTLEVEAGVEALGARGPHGLAYQPAPDGSDPDSGKAAPAGAHKHHHH